MLCPFIDGFLDGGADQEADLLMAGQCLCLGGVPSALDLRAQGVLDGLPVDAEHHGLEDDRRALEGEAVVQPQPHRGDPVRADLGSRDPLVLHVTDEGVGDLHWDLVALLVVPADSSHGSSSP
jgi:hypothetical protein